MSLHDNVILYQIYCIDDTIKDTYVGSCYELKTCISKHKNACLKWTNSQYKTRVHEFIRNHGGWENWQVKPLRQYKNINNYQLMKKLNKYITKYKPTLNDSKKTRAYREDNKVSITCKCGRIISKKAFEKHKTTKKHKDIMSQII